MTLPRLALITTGGTIGSRIDPETGAAHAIETPEDLLAMLPLLADVADIEIHPFSMVNSWDMSPQMMFDLATEASRHLERDDIHGVVITHGTDTVEETGLLVDLLVRSDKPVAFAVAMRNLSEIGADGPRNLADAIRVAADPQCRSLGSLLVVNQEVHQCRYVTKTNTVNPATFQSPEHGPVALIGSDGLRLLRNATARSHIDAPRLNDAVYVIKAVTGMSGDFVQHVVDEGAQAVIVEGSGAGNVPTTMVPGIRYALRRDVIVVLTTRVQRGFLSPVYGIDGLSGGGFDLHQQGVIPSPFWRSPQARIAVMAALGAGYDAARIRALLASAWQTTGSTMNCGPE